MVAGIVKPTVEQFTIPTMLEFVVPKLICHWCSKQVCEGVREGLQMVLIDRFCKFQKQNRGLPYASVRGANRGLAGNSHGPWVEQNPAWETN
jgi:hypothetical protein